jgi:hypothetical protein
VTSTSAIICEKPSEETSEDQAITISEGPFQREENALERSHQRVTYAAKRQKRLMARLGTPAWFSLSSHALEISCYKANSGWMFIAQTYRVVPDESPIIEFAQAGNVIGI